MWRRNIALKNRDYVVHQARRNRDALVEVANSEYSGRSASFRNGRFLASQISISSDKSSESKKLTIEVKKATGIKCERCWKILENKCARCEQVISKKYK